MAPTAMRMVVVAAWVGGMLALTSWSDTTPAIVCAAAATVATGLLVGRWWLPLVPTGPALVVVVGFLLSERDPGERWDAAPADYALWFFTAWAAIVALLAIGVAARKLLAAAHDRGGVRTAPGAHRRVPLSRG